MVMGHVGAILAVSWNSDSKLPANDPPKVQRYRYQFQIRHLLVATAWIAFVVALDSFAEGFVLIKFVLVWSLFQAILVLADRCWITYLAAFRRRRILPNKSSL